MPRAKHRNKQRNKNKKKKKQQVWAEDIILSQHASKKRVSQDALHHKGGSEVADVNQHSQEAPLPSNWAAVTSVDEQCCHGNGNHDNGWEEYWKMYGENLLWENWLQKYPDQAESGTPLDRHQVHDGNTNCTDDRSDIPKLCISCTQDIPHVVDALPRSEANMKTDSVIATHSEDILGQPSEASKLASGVEQGSLPETVSAELVLQPDLNSQDTADSLAIGKCICSPLAKPTVGDEGTMKTSPVTENFLEGTEVGVERASALDEIGVVDSTPREWGADWSRLWDEHCAEVYWYYHQYYHSTVLGNEHYECDGAGVLDKELNQSEKSSSEIANQSQQSLQSDGSCAESNSQSNSDENTLGVGYSLDESIGQSKLDKLPCDNFDQPQRDAECSDQGLVEIDSEGKHMCHSVGKSLDRLTISAEVHSGEFGDGDGDVVGDTTSSRWVGGDKSGEEDHGEVDSGDEPSNGSPDQKKQQQSGNGSGDSVSQTAGMHFWCNFSAG